MKNRILTLLIFFLLNSCRDMKINCEESAKEIRKTECLLIFESLPVFGQRYLNPKGKHLVTNKECECKDNSGWWSVYENYLEKGDTIIKRKGELIFSIHKKDTILNFNWECEGVMFTL